MEKKKTIKNRTDKAAGNVNTIVSGLNDKPYGSKTFRAAKVMREAMLMRPMLNNAETWINITKGDIDELTKPDTTLQRKLLSSSGNQGKVFMCIEIGFISVKHVIMSKRVKFLNCILNESIGTIVKKLDSQKGYLVDEIKEINIFVTKEEIKSKDKNE